MSDLISREEAIKRITRLGAAKGSHVTVFEIICEISNMPPAENTADKYIHEGSGSHEDSDREQTRDNTCA